MDPRTPSVRSAKRKRSPSTDEAAVKDKAAAEPDALFWIIVSNIHENVSQEGLCGALFKGCAQVRRHPPSAVQSHTGVFEVAFVRNEDAEGAVRLYQKNIKMFGRTWKLCNRRQKYNRSSKSKANSYLPAELQSTASSSETEAFPSATTSESSEDGLQRHALDAGLTQLVRAASVGFGQGTKVTVDNIDSRVPKEVVVPLFETVGRVRGYAVLGDSTGNLHAPIEVVLEQTEDAINAVKLFHDNVIFFKKQWVFRRIDESPENTIEA